MKQECITCGNDSIVKLQTMNIQMVKDKVLLKVMFFRCEFCHTPNIVQIDDKESDEKLKEIKMYVKSGKNFSKEKLIELDKELNALRSKLLDEYEGLEYQREYDLLSKPGQKVKRYNLDINKHKVKLAK
jgi:hypothetical protein